MSATGRGLFLIPYSCEVQPYLQPEGGDLTDLIVEHDGQTPIGVWKLIARVTKLDITQTQARKLFKEGSQPVIPGLSDEQAQALKIKFEALGATVRLRPS